VLAAPQDPTRGCRVGVGGAGRLALRLWPIEQQRAGTGERVGRVQVHAAGQLVFEVPVERPEFHAFAAARLADHQRAGRRVAHDHGDVVDALVAAPVPAFRAVVLADDHAFAQRGGRDVAAFDQRARPCLRLFHDHRRAVVAEAEHVAGAEDVAAGLCVDLGHGGVLQRGHPAGAVDHASFRMLASHPVLDVVEPDAERVAGLQLDGRRPRRGRVRKRRRRNRLDALFRDADAVELQVPVLGEGRGHVAVGHPRELRVPMPGDRFEVARADVVEQVRAGVVAAEVPAGDRRLDRAVARAALLVGEVHVQAVGFGLAGQVRMAIALMAVDQGAPVVQIQARRGVGVCHGVQFVSADAVGAGGRRDELEQPLGAVRPAGGLFVEGAAGLDIGKAHEVVARDPALACLALDDVEHFRSGVVACHRFIPLG